MISATDLGDDLGDDLGHLVWHSGYPNFRGDIARRHNILKVVSMATTTMFRLRFIVIEPDRGDCGVARFHQPCVSRARRLGIGAAGHHQHRSGRAGHGNRGLARGVSAPRLLRPGAKRTGPGKERRRRRSPASAKAALRRLPARRHGRSPACRDALASIMS